MVKKIIFISILMICICFVGIKYKTEATSIWKFDKRFVFLYDSKLNSTNIKNDLFPFQISVKGDCFFELDYVNTFYYHLRNTVGRKGEGFIICDNEKLFHVEMRDDYQDFINNQNYSNYEEKSKNIKIFINYPFIQRIVVADKDMKTCIILSGEKKLLEDKNAFDQIITTISTLDN